MDLIDGWLKVARQWYVYAEYCAGHSIRLPVCRPFWSWMMTATLVIGALIVLIVGWKIISNRMKRAAARRVEAAHQNAGAKATRP